MALRHTCISPDEALHALDDLKANDVRWREGRAHHPGRRRGHRSRVAAGPTALVAPTINAIDDGKISEFLTDLDAAIAEVLDAASVGSQGSYGTVE